MKSLIPLFLILSLTFLMGFNNCDAGAPAEAQQEEHEHNEHDGHDHSGCAHHSHKH